MTAKRRIEIIEGLGFDMTPEAKEREHKTDAWGVQYRLRDEMVELVKPDLDQICGTIESVYLGEEADILDWLDTPVTELELDLMAAVGEIPTARPHDPLSERTAIVEYPDRTPEQALELTQKFYGASVIVSPDWLRRHL